LLWLRSSHKWQHANWLNPRLTIRLIQRNIKI
jgi:hypothetical protein